MFHKHLSLVISRTGKSLHLRYAPKLKIYFFKSGHFHKIKAGVAAKVFSATVAVGMELFNYGIHAFERAPRIFSRHK